MGYSIWSLQCHVCYGTHENIIVKETEPSANFARCPFCGERMRVYELGKGFKVKPANLKIRMAA